MDGYKISNPFTNDGSAYAILCGKLPKAAALR